MEKIKIGFHMSTSWTDPPIRIMCLLPCGVAAASISLASLNSLWYESSWLATVGAVFPWLVSYCAWNFIYHPWWDEAAVDTRPFVLWRQPDSPMAIRYRHKRIPMACLYEYYIAGDLDFNPECEGGDCYLILNRHRDKFINYKITWSQVRWLLQQFLPAFVTGSGLGYGSSSGKTARETEKEIKEHYDKGNSVFSCMLGRSMVYTCALFETAPFFASDVYDGDYARSAADGSLEAAQHNKMRTICDKLHLKHGEQLLDIGCGWGTLMRHATAFKGAKSTGITLSVEGKRYCDHASLSTTIPTKTILSDYRLIPELDHQFEKVASIEMAEHVGIANFANPYLEKVKAFMKGPDSRFCLQVSGLKQQPSFEDLAWGLFMSRYIFPGADASTPLHWYIKQCELAGFEVVSTENIGGHYSHTLHKWYDNWMSHKESILSGEIDSITEHSTGRHMFRLQEFFLAWSTIIAQQGSATCYQIILKPNTYESKRFHESLAPDEAESVVREAAKMLCEICPHSETHEYRKKVD